ncbi:MAG: histidinol dehydrogenase [Elusimicrobia bacterium]|nr:histidinol dehydrogenase [Elusimicrobiota bacterium]
MGRVKRIIREVKRSGDRALIKFSAKFDRVRLDPGEIEISREEINRMAAETPKNLAAAISQAAENVSDYARSEVAALKEVEYEKKGIHITSRFIPVKKCGVYVPGGRYSYPSTVLMTAILAREVGVEEVIVSSPPGNITPALCYAAKLSGVSRMFRVGGAHSIAAMAYGTETIPQVDLIVGPGNSFVQRAKSLLNAEGVVGIDMAAGPSEVALIADEDQDPDIIATDLSAQAEHDPEAKAYLISWDSTILSRVARLLPREFSKQIEIIRVKTPIHAASESNRIAPEHLQLMCEPSNLELIIGEIRNAGAVFIGHFSPVALGDYWAGPSHTLPTGRTARFSEGLCVRTFLKNVAFITATGEGIAWSAPGIILIAEEEGMKYHALSLKKRVEKE